MVGGVGQGDEEWTDDEILEMVENLVVERPHNGTRHKRGVLSQMPKIAMKKYSVVAKFLKNVWSFLKNYLIMEGASGIQSKVEGMLLGVIGGFS